MRKITTEEYFEAFQKTNSHTRELMGSDKIYTAVKSALDNRQLEINPTDTLLPFGYYLLNLLTLEDILLELTNLGINDQFNFLQEVKKKLMESQNDIKAEIAETEAALKTLPTMTNTQVASRTEVYPSQQADILGAKNTTPSNSPRWGSES